MTTHTLLKLRFAAVCVAVVAVLCAVCFAPNIVNAAEKAETCARSAIVVERRSGRVLYEKNPDERLPNASTTKIATALAVVRNVPDVDRVVNVVPEACGVEGSSVYLQPGEKLTVRDLLYGLLLRSGNDCAVQLALITGGTVDAFMQKVNDLVLSLGCRDTHFVTPHGLHDEEHYTSARDLATIARAALDEPVLAEIAASKSYRVVIDGSTRVFVNKNKLLRMLDGADGVKTGYTRKAGRCFVGSATLNGIGVIGVVLDCGPMFEDVAAMCNKAFAEYTLVKAVANRQICGSAVANGKRTFYCCEQAFAYPIRSGETLTTEINLAGEQKYIVVKLNGKEIACIGLTKIK